MTAFQNDLFSQNWDPVLWEKSIDKAYVIFLKMFKNTYDKHYPIKTYIKKVNVLELDGSKKGLQKIL